MKTTLKILALVMAAAIACFAFVSCGDNNEDSSIKTQYHSGKEYADADFSKVETEVAYEDNENMSVVMTDITDGKYDNKVVTMEGTNTRYGNSCGILEKNEDGTYVGAMYYLIDGTYPTDYPAKGAHIKVTGLVVLDETTGARHLEVPKDKLEILD